MRGPANRAVTVRPGFLRRILLSFLRLFFKYLYHQFAWAYDLVAWIVSLGAWRKWIYTALPYLTGNKILEIGFGTGHLQTALLRSGITAWGVDESSQMAEITQRRLIKLKLPTNLTQARAEALPFAGQSFNQVVMTFPSDYILKPSAIAEVYRILTDHGSAVMVPLAWITGRKPLERLAAWVNQITGEAPKWDDKSTAVLKFTGFDTSWELVQDKTSKVLVIRMQKTSTEA